MSSPKLKPGIRYRVIKGNSTFRVGDHIWIEPDGAIMCREASGWICAEDAESAIKGISVEEVITMRPRVRYVVTYPSSDGTFREGDKLWTMENGSLQGYSGNHPVSIPLNEASNAIKGTAVRVDEEWARKVCREIMHDGQFAYQADYFNISESIKVELKCLRDAFESVVRRLVNDLATEVHND